MRRKIEIKNKIEWWENRGIQCLKELELSVLLKSICELQNLLHRLVNRNSAVTSRKILSRDRPPTPPSFQVEIGRLSYSSFRFNNTSKI
jgi:hypothetical protein